MCSRQRLQGMWKGTRYIAAETRVHIYTKTNALIAKKFALRVEKIDLEKDTWQAVYCPFFMIEVLFSKHKSSLFKTQLTLRILPEAAYIYINIIVFSFVRNLEDWHIRFGAVDPSSMRVDTLYKTAIMLLDRAIEGNIQVQSIE